MVTKRCGQEVGDRAAASDVDRVEQASGGVVVVQMRPFLQHDAPSCLYPYCATALRVECSAVSEGAGDEGELKLLKEVMKMSELDYLKDAGCLNLNAIKKKGNKEVEDDIDNLFGPDIPTK